MTTEWIVEIASQASSGNRHHTIKADSWFAALAKIRTAQGDESPLSGFALDIRDDVVVANDPHSRTKYTVRAAPPGSPSADSQGGGTNGTASSESTASGLTTWSSREDPPTPQRPLLYRELCFVASMTEDDAELALRRELADVRDDLSSVEERKFVAMALFSSADEAQAHALPIATLVWKDWRGDPVVVFPRRPSHEPPSMLPSQLGGSALEQIKAAAAPAVQPPPSGEPAIPLLTSAPATSELASSSTSSAVHAAEAVRLSVSSVPPEANRESLPPPPSGRAKVVTDRPPRDDLLAELFDQMQELFEATDAAHAARICLRIAGSVIGAEQVIMHGVDIDRREFVAIASAGGGGRELLLLRTSVKDPILGEVAKRRRAMIHYEVPPSITRYGALVGGERTVITAPALAAGRVVAVLELVASSSSRAAFSADDSSACSYIMERYGEYIASNGLTFEPSAVVRTDA